MCQYILRIKFRILCLISGVFGDICLLVKCCCNLFKKIRERFLLRKDNSPLALYLILLVASQHKALVVIINGMLKNCCVVKEMK